jgi:hypothetical protein
MADSGFKNPGTVGTDNSIGSIAWASTDYIKAGGVTYAYSQATANNSAVITNYIKGTNFGFTIPAGATINGIEFVAFRMVGYYSSSNKTYDYAARIIKGGSIGATDKKNGTVWSEVGADRTCGSSTELWGETWTADDINSSDFGVALAATIDNSPNQGIYASLNNFRLKVYYTEAAGPAALKTANGLAKASVKTRQGLAVASVKTWNGLT